MSVFRPLPEEIERSLAASDCDFSYDDVGATTRFDEPLPDALAERYDLDQRYFEIGHGRPCFESAARALFGWEHFGVSWVELHGATEAAHPGQTVASLVSVFGVWFLNPCRVIAVRPLEADADLAAFSYGTLPGHVEAGEERFAVHFDPSSGAVRYEISAFSRPAKLLPRLAYPLARRLQRQFAESTAQTLRMAIG